MKRLTAKLFIVTLAIALCQAMAFADPIEGTATGAYGNNTPSGSAIWSFGQFRQGSLVYTGADFFGDTNQPGALSPLGTFHLNAPGFSSGPNTTFTLRLAFSKPPGASADFFANVDASIFFLASGLVRIEFEDTPITVNYTGGSFALTVEDITLGSLLGFSCDQTLKAHISDVRPGVPEPSAILLLGVMGAAVWTTKKGLIEKLRG